MRIRSAEGGHRCRGMMERPVCELAHHCSKRAGRYLPGGDVGRRPDALDAQRLRGKIRSAAGLVALCVLKQLGVGRRGGEGRMLSSPGGDMSTPKGSDPEREGRLSETVWLRATKVGNRRRRPQDTVFRERRGSARESCSRIRTLRADARLSLCAGVDGSRHGPEHPTPRVPRAGTRSAVECS